MPELTTCVHAGAAAGGLTVFCSATGLDPVLVIAGLAGGFFSYYFMDPLQLPRRIYGALFASLGAGWGAPVLAAGLASFSWWPEAVSGHALQPIVALCLGFLVNPVIAPKSIQVANRRAEEMAK